MNGRRRAARNRKRAQWRPPLLFPICAISLLSSPTLVSRRRRRRAARLITGAQTGGLAALTTD